MQSQIKTSQSYYRRLENHAALIHISDPCEQPVFYQEQNVVPQQFNIHNSAALKKTTLKRVNLLVYALQPP